MRDIIIAAILVLLIAAVPAQADSVVFGLPIEITSATRAHGNVWYVEVRGRGQTDVRDTSGCGAPPAGSAYAQYVQLDNGGEVRTLYAGHCAYEIMP